MTAQEAINLLAQVVAQTRATAQEHNLMAEALRTLAPKQEPAKE